MRWRLGEHNSIIDVSGINCGHQHDARAATGVSVILPDESAVAGCDIRGGAPGVIGSEVLSAENIVEKIEGLFLSGGSVYGLTGSASGMTDWLGARGLGFRFSSTADILPAPGVSGAILFDLNNGGDKDWGERAPYYDLAKAACAGAGRAAFPLGNYGAGYGAVAGSVKGGLGSASAITEDGFEVGAMVAVNSFGSVIDPRSHRLWAAAFEVDGEMGGVDLAPAQGASEIFAESKIAPRLKANTVVAICAVNAALNSAEAKRLAIMAHDGIARAVRPAHTIFDGDSVFVVATGGKAIDEGLRLLALAELGGLMADCLARAIGRGVWFAETLHQTLSYREAFSL